MRRLRRHAGHHRLDLARHLLGGHPRASPHVAADAQAVRQAAHAPQAHPHRVHATAQGQDSVCPDRDQIATQVPSVYDVPLPNDVASLLEFFSVAVSFGLASIATTPLECVGLAGYWPRLVCWMIVPGVVMLMVVGLVLSSEAWRRLVISRKSAVTTDEGSRGSRVHHEPQRNPNILEKTLQPALVLMFVLYPKVSELAVDVHSCPNVTARGLPAHSGDHRWL